METWKWILIAIAAALASGLIVYIGMLIKLQGVKKTGNAEVAKYKQMLTDRMELESEGLNKLKKENADLKAANENLRVAIQSISQKPGRKEIQRLQVYQKAIDKLTIQSPGFGPAWQTALQDAEADSQKMFAGVLPFVRKHIPAKNDTQMLDSDE